MSLADLIKKRKTKKEATANSAKTAIDKGLSTTPLAKLAALALADNAGKPIPGLAHIGGDATISRWWRFHYPDRPRRKRATARLRPVTTHWQGNHKQ